MAWGVRPHPRINSVEALWFSSGVSFGSSPATPPTPREPGMRSPSRLPRGFAQESWAKAAGEF